MTYRSEIDGIRAIAVVSVILFHAGFEAFNGGFVGVDIFFVISGYLITRQIALELEEGRFSLAYFFERRARRILPALFLVCFACLPFAWIYMTPSHLEDFSKSLVATLLFFANIYFWRTSDYFSTAAEFKPLLHTWSLSIEEQFYLIFPIVLILLWRFGRNHVLALVAALALASLILSEWALRWEDLSVQAVFYLAPTRAFELLIGSICGLITVRRSLPANDFAAALGLAGILISIALYDESIRFPGVAALLPTLSTALLLLFAGSGSIVASLLSFRPFVGIGLISYSLYLWHQPVFAFARLRQWRFPDAGEMLLLIAGAFVLSYLSWRFVEQPIRRRQYALFAGGRRIAVSSTLVAGMLVAVAGVTWMNRGFDQRLDLPEGSAYSDLLGSMTGNDLLRACYDGVGKRARAELVCDVFTPDAPRMLVAVYGDSHGQAMLPAFAELSGEAGAHVVFGGTTGCPPLLGVWVHAGNHNVGVCHAAAQAQYEHAAQERPDVVFLIARWALYTDGEYRGQSDRHHLTASAAPGSTSKAQSRDVFDDALHRTVAAYRDLGSEVFIVTQTPQQMIAPRDIAERLAMQDADDATIRAAILASAVPEERFAGLEAHSRSAIEASARGLGAHMVDLAPEFLSEDRYPWSRDGISLWLDDDHLSASGAASLQPLFVRAMNVVDIDDLRRVGN